MTKKMKFRSAEEKRKFLENQKSWEELKAKYEPKQRLVSPTTLSGYSLSAPPGRECVAVPSLNSGLGVATRTEPLKYTGDKIIGIGTMHKSNMVPIFSDTEAKDLSTMRRN